MPFTPFHMGPGIIIKALFQGSFSLMVFGWAQIIMDLQPLIVMITGEGHLHGFSHTFVGASLLTVVATLSGKHLSEWGLRWLELDRFMPTKISWPVAFFSAAIGCASHVVLDAIMHHDVEPFFPVSLTNPLLNLLSHQALHQFCLYSGVVGAVVFFAIAWRQHRR
ncbi:hypothetical protein [Motilimonas sp. E26]|uniref:hypothetical protein n=1 Tax=Motilimonas sp. E26 TaxID=2865674 RepID=UPI001E294EDC|nr:hypothetical protein [Motilimonas sp. E26]MCE0556984.1 hypothetical protein [Motilimonas sp. E26]